VEYFYFHAPDATLISRGSNQSLGRFFCPSRRRLRRLNQGYKPMKIYTFASEAPSRLFAFAGDRAGSSLPAQHGPWKSVGELGRNEQIQHGLDRRQVEQAICEHGYQMWRMKKAP